MTASLAAAALIALAAGPGEAPATPTPMADYLQAVHAAVMQVWVKPASAGPDLQCGVSLLQRDGGEVVQVSFGNDCNADAATRASIERAVAAASPLPYAGHEQVFQRRIHLVFQYQVQ
jgi:colicin import membrane protein